MSIERPTTAVSSTRLKATNRRAWPDSRWRFIGDGLHSSSASDRKTSRIAGDTRQSASLSTFSTLGMSHSDTLQLTQEVQSNGHLDWRTNKDLGLQRAKKSHGGAKNLHILLPRRSVRPGHRQCHPALHTGFLTDWLEYLATFGVTGRSARELQARAMQTGC